MGTVSGMSAVLADPARRRALLDWTERLVALEHGTGVVFDFEELPASALANYRVLLQEARQRFAPHGWLVTLAVPLDNPDWNLRAFAAAADRLFLMNYDEHSPGDDPGPIASQPWFVANLERVMKDVPPEKAIVAIGNYGYDFKSDGTTDNLTDEEAWLAANDSQAMPMFDKASGTTTFSYGEDNIVHTVWMLDAASAWNQLHAAEAANVAGYALWRLGSEDPGYWAAMKALPGTGVPDLSVIRGIGNVDVEGAGELLRIEATPRAGARKITFDGDSLIRDQVFSQLPTPYVVRRGGKPAGTDRADLRRRAGRDLDAEDSRRARSKESTGDVLRDR